MSRANDTTQINYERRGTLFAGVDERTQRIAAANREAGPITDPASTALDQVEYIGQTIHRRVMASEARRHAAKELPRHDRPEVPTAFRVRDLDRWQGRIVQIEGDVFTAELVPEGDGPAILADFDIDKLGPDADAAVGDLVYVTSRSVVTGRLGYETTTSAIRLRRLGKWTTEDIDSVWRRADERVQSFAQWVE